MAFSALDEVLEDRLGTEDDVAVDEALNAEGDSVGEGEADTGRDDGVVEGDVTDDGLTVCE